MSLISILVALIIFGVILYLVEMVPMDATIKRIIQVLAILFIVIWALTKVLPSAGLNL